MDKVFALIECPTRRDTERAFIISGSRIDNPQGKSDNSVYPFGFDVTLALDAQSREITGLETITVTEACLISDCEPVDLHTIIPTGSQLDFLDLEKLT